jgi:hypothetical protein
MVRLSTNQPTDLPQIALEDGAPLNQPTHRFTVNSLRRWCASQPTNPPIYTFSNTEVHAEQSAVHILNVKIVQILRSLINNVTSKNGSISTEKERKKQEM